MRQSQGKRGKAPRSDAKISRNHIHHVGPLQLKKDRRCRRSCGRSYLECVVRAKNEKPVKTDPDIRGDIANEVTKLIGAGLRLPDIRKLGGMA